MRFPKRMYGVPIHPLIVHFPIALWLTALALDIAAVGTDPEPWWRLAFWATLLGVLMGAVGLVTGLLEYLEPSVAGIDMRLAARHGVTTTLAWCVFTAKLLFMTVFPPNAAWPLVSSLLLCLLGCFLLLQGVYFGTKQVYDQVEKQ